MAQAFFAGRVEEPVFEALVENLEQLGLFRRVVVGVGFGLAAECQHTVSVNHC